MFGNNPAESIWNAKQEHREGLIKTAADELGKFDPAFDEVVLNTRRVLLDLEG